MTSVLNYFDEFVDLRRGSTQLKSSFYSYLKEKLIIVKTLKLCDQKLNNVAMLESLEKLATYDFFADQYFYLEKVMFDVSRENHVRHKCYKVQLE